jgi:hypothetical protein
MLRAVAASRIRRPQLLDSATDARGGDEAQSHHVVEPCPSATAQPTRPRSTAALTVGIRTLSEAPGAFQHAPPMRTVDGLGPSSLCP